MSEVSDSSSTLGGTSWVRSTFPLSSVAFALRLRNGTREPLRPTSVAPLLGRVEDGFAPPSEDVGPGGEATVVFTNSGGRMTPTGEED